MDCPTCFRKIVVPQRSANSDAKFVLKATEAGQRSRPALAVAPDHSPADRRRIPLAAAVAGTLLLALLAGAIVFREQLSKSSDPGPRSSANAATATKRLNKPTTALAPDPEWSMSLADKKIPDGPVSGRVHGQKFVLTRTTLQGGTLTIRQGDAWPPDLGVTVQLFAKQSEDLAGRQLNLETTRTNLPKLTLRWKDDQGKAVNRAMREHYALRLEFGAVKQGRLPGQVYLCVGDEAQSWLAGSFEAEIRKPQSNAAKPSSPASH